MRVLVVSLFVASVAIAQAGGAWSASAQVGGDGLGYGGFDRPSGLGLGLSTNIGKPFSDQRGDGYVTSNDPRDGGPIRQYDPMSGKYRDVLPGVECDSSSKSVTGVCSGIR